MRIVHSVAQAHEILNISDACIMRSISTCVSRSCQNYSGTRFNYEENEMVGLINGQLLR